MLLTDFAHGDAYTPTRSGRLVVLDLLPPCACGKPSDDPLLRAIFAILDGEFEGIKELTGTAPGAPTNLAFTYFRKPEYHPLWISVDLTSIEGATLLLLLKDIMNGTRKSDRDLAASAIHAIEAGYSRTGRASEFSAAIQRILDKQHAQELRQ